MDYERLEPFGDRRADWHAASICSLFTNVIAASQGSKKRTSPKDFLLEFKKEGMSKATSQPNWKRLQAIGRTYAAMANAMNRADEKKRLANEQRRSRHRNPVGKNRTR